MIPAHELYQNHARRQQSRMDTYASLLQKIEKRILHASNLDQYECLYEVPGFLIGQPLYKAETCMLYLYMKLSRLGYVVTVRPPNRLHITWRRYVDEDDGVVPQPDPKQALAAVTQATAALTKATAAVTQASTSTSTPTLAPPPPPPVRQVTWAPDLQTSAPPPVSILKTTGASLPVVARTLPDRAVIRSAPPPLSQVPPPPTQVNAVRVVKGEHMRSLDDLLYQRRQDSSGWGFA